MLIKKIIIDTDIGDDIDDAIALVLALKSPEIDLAGVTTVYKNTRLRVLIALKILEVYGRSDIPVHAGIGTPLLNRADCEDIPCQFDIVDKGAEYKSSVNAVDFIIDTVKSHPGITILCLGPLTNIAAAIIKETGAMKNSRLVIMGGMISNPYPECNISTDPEAAAIVFDSGMPIVMVGLDVTLKCSMKDEHVKMIHEANDEKLKLLSKLIMLWNKRFLIPILKGWGMEINEETFCSGPSLHDPLALGFIINPGFFETKPSKILIETQGKYTRGITVDSINVFNGKPNGYNADVCINVDSDGFADMLIERILS